MGNHKSVTEDIMNFDIESPSKPIIKIIGVGGGGSNAVDYMYTKGIKDVDFVVCNTDLMALESSSVPKKIQLGVTASEGNGAGNNPVSGEQAAIENLDDVIDVLSDGTKMVFITAGMGGGTGTGASPVIAKAAKEKGILTVAIVTIPFRFEGPKRIKQANEGIARLAGNVDSILIIDNDKLNEIYGNLSLKDAFAKADDVVANAARGIAELITLPGYVNVDFEDVKTIMTESGVAIMGSAKANGEDRALDAIQEAITSPLLDNNDINGAEEILLNIVSGVDDNEITMDEVTTITDYVLDEVGGNAQVIWGVGNDTSLEDNVSITIIATGFEPKPLAEVVGVPGVEFEKPKRFSSNNSEENEDSERKNPTENEGANNDVVEEDVQDEVSQSGEGESEQVAEPAHFDIEVVNREGTELQESEFEEVQESFNDNKADKVAGEFKTEPQTECHVQQREYKQDSKEGNADKFKVYEESEDSKYAETETAEASETGRVVKEEKQEREADLDSSRPTANKRNANVGDVFYGQVVMKPEMSESDILKIEVNPAYKRRKPID